MKRILATILCLTIIMSLGASIGLAKEFPDVDASHWAYKYIDELSNNGVINGYDDGSFNPQGTITRAEFIKLIVSTSPDVLKLTESIIEDESIETKNWYDKYYAAAGIVMNALPREYSDEELNKPITRVEMAYIVDQFCEYRGLYEEEENYDVLVNQEEYNQAIRKYAKENNFITDDKLTDDEFNNAFLDLSDEQREKVVKDVTENIDLQTIPIDELIEGFEYLKQAMIEKGYIKNPDSTYQEVSDMFDELNEKKQSELIESVEEGYLNRIQNQSYDEEWAIYEVGKEVMVDEGYIQSGDISEDEFIQILDNMGEIQRLVFQQTVAKEYFKETNQVFNDVSSLSTSNLSAIVNVKNYGLINGYEDGSFKPFNNMTRAEASTIIYKYLDIVGEAL